MLDYDLAELYQVETKRLKEAVRRNIERFEGEDFMFELTHEEYNSLIISLRTQIATSNARNCHLGKQKHHKNFRCYAQLYNVYSTFGERVANSKVQNRTSGAK
jgi:hypothetical protein